MGAQHLPGRKLGELNAKAVIDARRLWIRPGSCRLRGHEGLACGCVCWPPIVGKALGSCVSGTLITFFQKLS